MNANGLDIIERCDLEELVVSIKQQIGNDQIALVVIDTIRKTTDGNEDNATDMGVYIKHAQTLGEEVGGFVVAVTHSGKDKSRGARGSNVFKTDVDAQWLHEKVGKSVRVTCKKMKDGEANGTFEFRLDPVAVIDAEGNSAKTCDVVYLDESIRGESDVEGANAEKIKLTPDQHDWVKAVDEAILEERKGGARPPGSDTKDGKIHEPAVRLSTVIEHMDASGQFETLKERTSDAVHRNAMNRMKTLQRKGLIRFHKSSTGSDNVWIWRTDK
jgi:hypothetical protein